MYKQITTTFYIHQTLKACDMTTTTLSIEEVLRQGNSTTNQDIKGKFIGREVFCNVNTMVEYCLRQSYESNDAPFTYEDIENYYSYPEYYNTFANFDGGTDDDRDMEIGRLEGLKQELEDKEGEDMYNDMYTNSQAIEQIEEDVHALENLETEPDEIYEWWAVSPWFADKLKAHGECILDTGSCMVWGRCATGQAILLDYVITRICADMEILDGQSNTWANL